MAEAIQHVDARKLLDIISVAKAQKQALTYSGVAVRMGRPANHSRAMASTCNLLDAAACLAGVPLLALIAVLAEGGDVNPAAFAREFDDVQRQDIIDRSFRHSFTENDYGAIASALDDLGDKGAVRAWHFIETLYPGNLLYLRLTGEYSRAESNAIDDIGTDAPERFKSEVWQYPRDPKVRDAVLKRANGKCEFCDAFGFVKKDGSRYLETHHIIALANDGEDRVTNVIALCANDHREAHFGTRREELEKNMIGRLSRLSL